MDEIRTTLDDLVSLDEAGLAPLAELVGASLVMAGDPAFTHELTVAYIEKVGINKASVTTLLEMALDSSRFEAIAQTVVFLLRLMEPPIELAVKLRAKCTGLDEPDVDRVMDLLNLYQSC
jgi:hypothetical protein